MTPFDRLAASAARALARRSSRRGLLARFAAALGAGAALPLLPLLRVGPAAAEPEREPAPGEPDRGTPEGDPRDCSYWRYCAIDGFLASCCGGTQRSCPPGTEMSPITWLGTCRNPADGRLYVISYNDCCGKEPCGHCMCRRNEGDRPVYVTPRSNDINWCLGTRSAIYNSTVAVVVGVATESG